MKPASLATLLLVAGPASAFDLVPAKRAPIAAVRRSSFYGAWPLAAVTCPSNTTECSTYGTCCPESTTCYTDGLAGGSVCCPNANDCYEVAHTLPLCADPSWTLYIGNYDYFCCAPGQVGVLPNKASSVAMGLCYESNVPVPAGELATQYGGPPNATATATSTAVKTAAATVTVSSGSSIVTAAANATAATNATAPITTTSGAASTQFAGTTQGPSTTAPSPSIHTNAASGMVKDLVFLGVLSGIFAVFF